MDAIFYLLRSGCAWRVTVTTRIPTLENGLPVLPFWRLDGIWECINVTLRTDLKISYGRKPEPSAVILDSQSVQITETPGARGYDASKKV